MHQVCARERRHVHFEMVEHSRLLESAFGMQEHRSWKFRWLVYLSIYVFPLRDCECACVCALSVSVHVRGWPQKPLIWSVILIVEGMGLSLAWGLSIRLIHVYTSPMLGLQTHVNTPGLLTWVWGIQIRPPVCVASTLLTGLLIEIATQPISPFLSSVLLSYKNFQTKLDSQFLSNP